MYSFFPLLSLFLSLFLFTGCSGQFPYFSTSIFNKQEEESLSSLNHSQLQNAVSYWRGQYESNPESKIIGLQFADILRRTNNNDQSLAVMEQMVIKHPEDQVVLAAYGKALVGAGRLHKALGTIQRAQTPDNPDWKLISARGVILDQLGETDQAREHYRQALELNPNAPSVLSNLGMSYLLTGDLVLAERHLKLASTQQGADTQIRQNLSLVLSLQGKYKEAVNIGATELPVLDAQQNIQFIRQMITSHNSHERINSKKG